MSTREVEEAKSIIVFKSECKSPLMLIEEIGCVGSEEDDKEEKKLQPSKLEKNCI